MRTKCNRMDLIRNLNLWGNDLHNISVLRCMPNLEVLSLSVNSVSTLADLRGCPKLSELYLRKNNIRDLSEVQHLMNLRHLRVLWLNDNPCSTLAHYRHYVLHHLPHLTKLDSQDVTEEERRHAAMLSIEDMPTTVGDGDDMLGQEIPEPSDEEADRWMGRRYSDGGESRRSIAMERAQFPPELAPEEDMYGYRPPDRRSMASQRQPCPEQSSQMSQHGHGDRAMVGMRSRGDRGSRGDPGDRGDRGDRPERQVPYDDHRQEAPQSDGHDPELWGGADAQQQLSPDRPYPGRDNLQQPQGAWRGSIELGGRGGEPGWHDRPSHSAWQQPDGSTRNRLGGESNTSAGGPTGESMRFFRDQQPADWGDPRASVGGSGADRPGRGDNILCAVLALTKELDRQGLELVRRAVQQRLGEL